MANVAARPKLTGRKVIKVIKMARAKTIVFEAKMAVRKYQSTVEKSNTAIFFFLQNKSLKIYQTR